MKNAVLLFTLFLESLLSRTVSNLQVFCMRITFWVWPVAYLRANVCCHFRHVTLAHLIQI